MLHHPGGPFFGGFLSEFLKTASKSCRYQYSLQLVLGGGRGWRRSPKLQVNAVSQFRDIKSQGS